jgi:hypothetical protein
MNNDRTAAACVEENEEEMQPKCGLLALLPKPKGAMTSTTKMTGLKQKISTGIFVDSYLVKFMQSRSENNRLLMKFMYLLYNSRFILDQKPGVIPIRI